MERKLHIVDDEERYALIRRHVTTASEVIATFEAAFEDNISLDRERSLEMLREGLEELKRAHRAASAAVVEIDPNEDLTD